MAAQSGARAASLTARAVLGSGLARRDRPKACSFSHLVLHEPDTSNHSYRCVHVMVGNEKMTAQLGGVCLLRKRELSLESGFSYDLFMEMLGTLRFME